MQRRLNAKKRAVWAWPSRHRLSRYCAQKLKLPDLAAGASGLGFNYDTGER